MSLLRVDNLSYKIGSKDILEGISFEVKTNKTIAVLGPNGSGKSHLLKSLVGILKDQDKSKVYLHDKPLNLLTSPQIAQQVSWSPQNPTEAFDFSVDDFLKIGLFGAAYSEKETAAILEALAILDLRFQRLSQLSGGERGLCYFARTLLRDTPLMLFDEPDANLDISYKLKIMDMIKSLKKQTTLIAMHDINLALRYADEMWFMRDGKLLYQCADTSRLDLKRVSVIFSVEVKSVQGDGGRVLVFNGKSKSESTHDG